jgi:hypothetical protein
MADDEGCSVAVDQSNELSCESVDQFGCE